MLAVIEGITVINLCASKYGISVSAELLSPYRAVISLGEQVCHFAAAELGRGFSFGLAGYVGTVDASCRACPVVVIAVADGVGTLFISRPAEHAAGIG